MFGGYTISSYYFLQPADCASACFCDSAAAQREYELIIGLKSYTNVIVYCVFHGRRIKGGKKKSHKYLSAILKLLLLSYLLF